jgi:hypothetical protein
MSQFLPSLNQYRLYVRIGKHVCLARYLRPRVGNFDSRSLPNSGDFDEKIFKMSKFPWVSHTPPPLRGKTLIGA